MTMTTANINIGLSDEQSKGVADILRRLLADEHILYTKLRNYHWNVIGINFHVLHEMFQEQYEDLEGVIDDVAERSRQIGAPAIGTLEEFSEFTTLTEEPGVYPNDRTMISNLLADHETIIRHLRQDLRDADEKYNDMGTSDFLTGLMEKHEKHAWMLRAMVAESI